MVAALRRHFGKVLGGIALASLGLGTAGFLTCDATCTVATALYRSVQLFYWNYFPWNTTAEAAIPWTLELARWLAPLATLGALSHVAIAVFHRRWDAFRARRARGHFVICGAGEKGTTLARELVAGGSAEVVIIERDATRVEALAESGALVIDGDATQAAVLQRAAVAQAARLFVTTGSDHENLAIALTAAHLAAGQAGKLAIHAHTRDASLSDLYRRNRAMAASLHGATSVRVFNHSRNVARRILQEFPPEPPAGEAHVVLPALSGLGSALAEEYALLGHFAGDRRIRLHIVGCTAAADLATLRRRHPGIDQCATIDALDLPSPEHFSSSVAALIRGNPAHDRFTVFPGFAGDHEVFARALEIAELTRSRPALRVLLPGGAESSIRALVEANPALAERIAFLPSPESTGSFEAIVGETFDRTARAIHENWLAETTQQITAARARGDEALARRHEMKATFKPWDELNEEQKGANRSQADHIGFKIRAAGFDRQSVTKAEWAQLSPEQIETLARMEHARWAAYYWMTGWTYAAVRNDDQRQHPDLVTYDDLDEPTKDYDREAVRRLGEYLGPQTDCP